MGEAMRKTLKEIT